MVAVDQAANIGIQFQGKRQSGPRFHHLVDTDEAHAGRYDRRKAGDADGGRHVRRFVMLICEVKSPIPPRWAKDQLRALAPDNVSKAFRQTEAIGAFLQTPEGIEFIRSVVPEGGLEHFNSFVTVIQRLIITSDNAGMFFGHEQTPILNFRTLERLLRRSDGDILHIRTCISRYNEGADMCLETVMVPFKIDGLSISYEGFRPTTLVDFPQAEWRGSPDRQKLIDDFVAGGYHPFDCLAGHESVVVARPLVASGDDATDPPATPG
jgi:hypothetical protein